MRDELLIEDFRPRSELVVPEHHVMHSKFPVIDAHNHLPINTPRMANVDLDEMVRGMDFVGVRTIVNLSGFWGDELKLTLDKLDNAHPGRFVTFCNVDWVGVGRPGWMEKTAAQLEADVKAGARGLKIFKRLGLHVRDDRGKIVMPDDPRISDLWDKAAELGVPVLIHTADPIAFFRPLDRFNERRSGLIRRPDWYFYSAEFPPLQELIDSLYRLIEAHPKTNFITAHVGCLSENPGFVSDMLDKYPNMYTDISARINELGRAPYSARKLFLKHPDRILFGTDMTPSVAWYQTYFRFMETADEHFDPSPHGSGYWKIYGVFLPDDVLQKTYYDNAARLIGL